jgi:hypothetical protein
MTRRIVLELGPQTTATECGDCPYIYDPESDAGDQIAFCAHFHGKDCIELVGVPGRWQRMTECRAAEQPAKEPD